MPHLGESKMKANKKAKPFKSFDIFVVTYGWQDNEEYVHNNAYFSNRESADKFAASYIFRIPAEKDLNVFANVCKVRVNS